MITAKMIWDLAADSLHFNATERTKLYTPTTMAYWDLCELTDWPRLRKRKTIAFTGTAVDLGTDVIGVTAVVDDSGDPLWEVKHEDVETTGGRSRWYKESLESASSLAANFKVQIVDSDGAALTDTVTVHYWVYPPALANDADLIHLPGSRALIINTILYALTLIDHDPQTAEYWRGELEIAKAELLSKKKDPARFTGGPR